MTTIEIAWPVNPVSHDPEDGFNYVLHMSAETARQFGPASFFTFRTIDYQGKPYEVWIEIGETQISYIAPSRRDGQRILKLLIRELTGVAPDVVYGR